MMDCPPMREYAGRGLLLLAVGAAVAVLMTGCFLDGEWTGRAHPRVPHIEITAPEDGATVTADAEGKVYVSVRCVQHVPRDDSHLIQPASLEVWMGVQSASGWTGSRYLAPGEFYELESLDIGASALDGGLYPIVATIEDYEGRTDTDVILVTLDTGGSPPPTIAIDSPADGESFDGSLPFTVTATTAGGPAEISVTLRGIGPTSTQPAGTVTWSDVVGISTAPDGFYDLEATVTDGMGRIATTSVNVRVANSRPPLTVTITTPQDGDTIRGGIDVALALGGVGTPLYDATVRLGSLEQTFSFGTPTVSMRFDDTSLLANGPHTLEATVTDSTGQVATDSITVNLDNLLGVVTVGFDSPTQPTVSGDVEVTSIVFGGTGPYDWLVAMGGIQRTGTDVPGVVFATSIPTEILVNGPYDITAIVTDANGATGSATITVNLENPD